MASSSAACVTAVLAGSGFLMDKPLGDVGLHIDALSGTTVGCLVPQPQDCWLALVLQLRDLAVGAAGRGFLDFLGDGLWFFNIVLQTMGHRGETRRALPCRCQPWVTLTGYFPLQAHVRGPPPPWGASGNFATGEGGLAVVAPIRCSVGDAMGPALGPPSTPTSTADGLALI